MQEVTHNLLLSISAHLSTFPSVSRIVCVPVCLPIDVSPFYVHCSMYISTSLSLSLSITDFFHLSETACCLISISSYCRQTSDVFNLVLPPVHPPSPLNPSLHVNHGLDVVSSRFHSHACTDYPLFRIS